VRLALKSFQAIRVGRELLGQKLQRDIAVQLGVGCAIHLAHSALTKERSDLIRAESCAGSDHRDGVNIFESVECGQETISRLYVVVAAVYDRRLCGAKKPASSCFKDDARLR